MALCERPNSSVVGAGIPAGIVLPLTVFQFRGLLRTANSGRHGQTISHLDLAPEAICIGPSEPDRACSTNALLVPRSHDPVTRDCLLVFGRSAQSWAASDRLFR